MERYSRNAFFALAFFLSPSLWATQPDPKLTPGSLCTAMDPNFSEYRYKEQIPVCKRNVSHAEKLKIAEAYGGIPESAWANYEFDHLIPLASGGSDEISNVWPQPITEALEKDKVEDETYNGLNNGTLTQAQAIQEIRDWISQH